VEAPYHAGARDECCSTAARVGVGAHACSLAGALFDRSGSYASTVWVAAGINVVGMLVAGRLPAR